MKPSLAARLTRLEAARRPQPRIFVVIGDGEPRHAGEIWIGGKRTDETPAPHDVVIQLAYAPAELTNPNPAPSVTQPTAPVASTAVVEVPAVDALVLAAQARVARAYARRSR